MIYQDLKIKNKFVTNTFCVIDEKLILDPTEDEVSISDYYFSNINFVNDESKFLFLFLFLFYFIFQ